MQLDQKINELIQEYKKGKYPFQILEISSLDEFDDFIDAIEDDNMYKPCRDCNGSGIADGESCCVCGGSGKLEDIDNNEIIDKLINIRNEIANVK